MPIRSVGLDQRYLVLPVLTRDRTLPSGRTAAQVLADLQVKLDHSDRLWREVTYGKASFRFDVAPTLLALPGDLAVYYRGPTAASVQTTDMTVFPITWAGGEVLEIRLNRDRPVAVTFPAGTQDALAVRTIINDAILATYGSMPMQATLSSQGGVRTFAIHCNSVGSRCTVEVLPGAAARALGLDPGQVAPVPGHDIVDDDHGLIADAVAAWRASGATAPLGSYGGVIVMLAATGATSYRASAGRDTFADGGATADLSWVTITEDDRRDVYAHEIGHNLGLPDLYDEATDAIDEPGLDPAEWDVMSDNGDRHTCAWCKHVAAASGPAANDGWMTDVAIMTAPPADRTVSTDFLIFPSETPFPPAGTYAGQAPSAVACHAVRIEIGAARAIYLENRQEGPFADPVVGSATFDVDLPDPPGGVLATDVVDTWSELQKAPTYRRHVKLAGETTAALQQPGDEQVLLRFAGERSIRARVKAAIGRAYLVEVVWGGAGGDVDCHLEPWNPTPWESPDIWVDTQVDNDWDEYRESDPAANPDVVGHPVRNGDRCRVGWLTRVYARVHNTGSLPRRNVRVEVEAVVPAGIGPVPGHLLGATVIDVPARGSALARIEWTPRNANEGHVCIVARATSDPAEVNPFDNEAQENLSDWYLEGASPYAPVRIDFRIANPVARRAPLRLRARDLPAGWAAGFSQDRYVLDPGEVADGTAIIGADIRRVPYEDVLVARGERAPIVSIEGLVKHGCLWLPVGGVSATVHPVRKTTLRIVRVPGPGLTVRGELTTAAGPVGKTLVTARLVWKGRPLWLGRARTDRAGTVIVEVPPPRELPRGASALLEVHASPTVGHGPAEATPLPVRFDGGDRVWVGTPIVAPPPARLEPGVEAALRTVEARVGGLTRVR